MVAFEKLELLRLNNTFVVLDVETTGLSYDKGDTVTDVCAYRLVDGKVVDKFNKLINPGKSISPFISDLTGITDDMVKWAPKFNEIAQEFVNFVGYDIVVGHNVKFDWNNMLHKILLNQCGYNAPNATLCTLELSREFVKRPGLKHKLEDMYVFMTGEHPNIKHRAEADVVMTVEVFNRLREFILGNYEQIKGCYGIK